MCNQLVIMQIDQNQSTLESVNYYKPLVQTIDHAIQVYNMIFVIWSVLAWGGREKRGRTSEGYRRATVQGERAGFTGTKRGWRERQKDERKATYDWRTKVCNIQLIKPTSVWMWIIQLKLPVGFLTGGPRLSLRKRLEKRRKGDGWAY